MTTHESTADRVAPRREASLWNRFWRWEASGILVALVALILALSFATETSSRPTTSRSWSARRRSSASSRSARRWSPDRRHRPLGRRRGRHPAIVGSIALTQWGLHPWLVIPFAMAFGFVLGSINGAIVWACEALSFHLSRWRPGRSGWLDPGHHLGKPRAVRAEFEDFGKGEVFNVPVPVILFFASAIILIWMLRQKPGSADIFAVGGNRDAAILAGIRSGRVEFFCFAFAGMFAALAGILYASRMDAGQPSVGEDWLMPAITAAILGGTSLRGGQGSIVGTVLGALLLAVLQNGTVLMNVSGYWQRVIVGAVVLVAVLVDSLWRRGVDTSCLDNRGSAVADMLDPPSATAQLNELKTRIAWLYHVEGMTQDEVARVVGLNRSRVLRILAAARKDGTCNSASRRGSRPAWRWSGSWRQDRGLARAIVVPEPQSQERIRRSSGPSSARW